MFFSFSFFFLVMFVSGVWGFVFLVFLICGLLCLIGIFSLGGDTVFYNLGEGVDYECGFESLYSKGGGFSLQFYIVGLSFLLFDLEISLFLPLVGVLPTGGVFFVVGVVFLLILLLGYLFELGAGALSW
uniref:NADH-ubiquinone oxidoreductase chain 3 n=1 Tax=Halocynthia spinosa TaxID=569430 RepID=S0DFE3_HALSF|nr:NADH dehydrogenase subunit 3 [Halocynthia spinosa]CCO25771.1 NADH dehydrogenase subunit 3 [Halocynthia spinosa]